MRWPAQGETAETGRCGKEAWKRKRGKRWIETGKPIHGETNGNAGEIERQKW